MNPATAMLRSHLAHKQAADALPLNRFQADPWVRLSCVRAHSPLVPKSKMRSRVQIKAYSQFWDIF